MSHDPPSQRLDQLDAHIDRCGHCGAWRWRGRCHTCQLTSKEGAA